MTSDDVTMQCAPCENFLYGFKAAPRGRLETRGGRPGRGGFDKGTLAAALIGHCGQARSQWRNSTTLAFTFRR
jgi:hypothetical protein